MHTVEVTHINGGQDFLLLRYIIFLYSCNFALLLNLLNVPTRMVIVVSHSNPSFSNHLLIEAYSIKLPTRIHCTAV